MDNFHNSMERLFYNQYFRSVSSYKDIIGAGKMISFPRDTVERLDQNVNNTVYYIGDYDAVSR